MIRGFTLIELLIICAIIGVIILYASPAMRPLVGRQMSDDVRGDVTTVFNYARNLAMSQQRIVHVCGNSDPNASNCEQDVNDWNALIIHTAPNAIETNIPGANKISIKSLSRIDEGIRVEDNTGSKLKAISFDRLGKVATSESANQYIINNISIRVRSQGKDACVFELNPSGQVNNPSESCK